MKKLCLLIFGFLPLFAFADPVVSNIRASQRENTKLVDILYDVTYSGDSTVSVTCEVSTNSGASYDVSAEHFSGTGYGVMVTTGVDRVITWNAGIDWDENYSEQMKVRITAETPRFTDHGDGTITDNETGLMWQKSARLMDYSSEFVTLARDASDLGDGWRLPTLEEYQSLYDPDRTPALPAGHPFENIWSGIYWTSSLFLADGTRIYYNVYNVATGEDGTLHFQYHGANGWAVRSIY